MKTKLLKKIRKRFTVISYNSCDVRSGIKVIDHNDKKVRYFYDIHYFISFYYDSITSVIFDKSYYQIVKEREYNRELRKLCKKQLV